LEEIDRLGFIIYNNCYKILDDKMQEKVKEILGKEVRSLLAMDGSSIDLVSAENGAVKVRLSGACAGCPMSKFALANFVEARLKEKVPKVIMVDDIRDRFRREGICY
jgi:Fe-S cluster biogenesis protein NfuA